MGGRTVSQSYGYSAISSRPETVNYAKDNLPVRYTMSSTRYIDYNYDSLNRLTGKTLSLASPLSYAYTYKASARGGSYTTTQIATETVDGNAYSYTYDSLGNITSIKLNGQAFRSYEYDSLNQLVRENNKTDNKTYEFVYDNYGNITAKKIYAYTTGSLGAVQQTISYAYGVDSDAGWKNILKSYNGENIDYDEIGNPITYRGATLDWDTRELKSYSKNGTEITYKYDADGLRASKTVNGVTTTYQYIGNQLMYEECNGAEKYYFYDSNGVISGIRYFDANGNMTMIYVVTNALGDVIALYDKNGNAVVEYQYDAWGNIISVVNSTEGSNLDWNEINPFRYRGYYWDSETELYYLQSRYYDAETGRFLNADVLLDNRTLSSVNPFVYCGNNPVVREDACGTKWSLEALWEETKEVLTAAAVAVVGVGETAVGVMIGCPALIDVGVKTAATGGTMVYGAITDTPVVVDVSLSGPVLNGYIKNGGSVIIDYKSNNIQLYGHTGGGVGYSSGFSYSVGVVNNYSKPADYSGSFLDVNNGYNIGVDHCWTPFQGHNIATQATSITFSSGINFGVGYDYYSKPMQLYEW